MVVYSFFSPVWVLSVFNLVYEIAVFPSGTYTDGTILLLSVLGLWLAHICVYCRFSPLKRSENTSCTGHAYMDILTLQSTFFFPSRYLDGVRNGASYTNNAVYVVTNCEVLSHKVDSFTGPTE